MNKTPADQPVRHRIEHELDRTFLVEAGAGSGKTHCLARRIARGIASGHYQIEQVAAVTFTRKAAAELRGRLQLALETLVSANPSPKELARIEKALKSIERFFAGTIHSFCGHLLRERPVEANIAPGFVEIDDVEDQHRRKQSWRDFVARERGSGSKLMLDLQDAGVKPPDLDTAFAIVCDHEEVEFPPGDNTPPDSAAAWKSFGKFFVEIDKLMPVVFDPDTTCNVQKAVIGLRDRMKVLSRNKPGDLADILRLFEGSIKPVNMRWGDGSSRNNRVAGQVSTLIRDFRAETVIPWLRSWRQHVYHLVISALTLARTTYASERRRDNIVNYTDLLSAAARLLRTDASVRRELQQKHRWILVDEFQDTDPIQAEVLLLLAANEDLIDDLSNVDWSHLQLRPGALFIVGDPKQSIYRFRRADIEVYNAVKRLIEASSGEVLSLNACFRSLPEVCSLANEVFPGRFPKVATSEAPKFELLEPVRTSEAANGKALATGIATLTVPESSASSVEREEATRIARYIKGEVVARRRAHGDFLVVTRQRTNLGVYAAALEELEIPVEVSGAGMFTSSPDVAALSLLLTSIADPLDSVSLVGVLRGPIFGVSDQELFAYRQSGNRFELTAPVAEVVGNGSRASAALNSLRYLYKLTRTLPAGAALEMILDETGLLALAATSPGGAGAGNLLQAVDMVRQVTEMGGSLAEAAEAIKEDAPMSTEIESLPLEPGRKDVVRVMNLHRVKGLEAPVVFLADPTHAYVSRPEVRIIREGGRSRGYMKIQRKREGSFTRVTLGEPSDWSTHTEIEERYTNAEVNRLLYVAATRARDLLVISRVGKKGEPPNKAWVAFDAYLSRARELEILPVPQKLDFEIPDCSSEVRSHAMAARAERAIRLGQPTWTVTRATDDAHHRAAAKRIRNELADEPIVTVAIAPDDVALLNDTPSHGADSGYAWGLLIHGLLEHAMARKDATRKDLERLARWLTVEFPDLREFIGSAVDVVERVSKADFWREASDASECHVEAPFAIQLPGPSDGVPSVLHGIIDLVYRANEGWNVLDYKTDQVNDASELVNRYRTQVAQYVDAWQSLTKSSDAEGSLYSVRNNQKVVATPRLGAPG